MSDILVHADAGVMTLTFNRVEKKNSITAAMYAALADALAQARDDNAIRVVVIQGHETVFSAGNDIGDFLNKPPSTPESPVQRFLHGIAAFPKPIVAAVCGPAVGIGTTMLGGLGARKKDNVALMAVQEEIGRTCVPFTFPPDSPNLHMLIAVANEEQRTKYLDPYARGEAQAREVLVAVGGLHLAENALERLVVRRLDLDRLADRLGRLPSESAKTATEEARTGLSLRAHVPHRRTLFPFIAS